MLSEGLFLSIRIKQIAISVLNGEHLGTKRLKSGCLWIFRRLASSDVDF